MIRLNLPSYDFKTRMTESGKTEIFDSVRKKYLVLTPEEWVRQNFIQFLIHEKSYPPSLILIEKGLNVHQLKRRFDAVVYTNGGQPAMLLEFKAPGVKVNQQVFQQIANYNLQLRVKYLLVSNGLKHYCCEMDYVKQSFVFLSDIPDFSELPT
jgi:hypothetical protein